MKTTSPGICNRGLSLLRSYMRPHSDPRFRAEINQPNLQVGEKEDASSKTSKCVIELQRRLPLARVVYASATGVTELGNLAYCERLGLWGEGCPFPDFEAFLKVVSRKGIFFLEMLAMELKREGAYVSRGLSFKKAEFETLNLALTPSQTLVYNAAAVLWRDLRLRLEEAVALTNASGRINSVYWGCHQRFFKQLISSLKVDTVVAEAKHGLAAGYAVVIGLQQTGEASMARKMSQSAGTVSFLSSARESLIALIEDHFPTVVQPAKGAGGVGGDDLGVGPSAGVLSSQPTPHKDGDSGHGASLPEGSTVDQCVAWKAELLKRVQELDLPASALDMLIDELGGTACVAEMTGRSHRIVRRDNGHIVHEQRGKGDGDVERVNVTECKAFQDGKKLVSIISDAASVGISLHAKRGGSNERRRLHLTMELPWSADKAVQQLGRSHRSNQSSAPVYKLVVSDLGGEKCFCSAVARRLQSLGALTKGDRRAATGQDLQEFNVQTSMGTAALRKVYASIDEGAPLPHFTASGAGGGLAFDGNAMEDMQASLDFIGLGPGRKEADVTNVGKFLSRLLGLPVNQQNRIFDYFMDTLSHDIAVAEKEGHYSDAIRDLYGDSVVTLQKSEDFYTDPITHATCSVHSLHVDRGMEWEAALSRLQKAQEEQDFKGGFFESKNMVPGRNATGWLMAIQKEGSPGEFQIWRPNTGYTGSALTYEDLKIKYSKRDQEAAERAWRKIYDESKGWDSDRDKGARCFTVRLLAGSLIPVWDQIHDVVQRASARGGAGVTSSQAEMKVVRMTDKTGMHYIGLRLPEGVIKSVKQKLDAHADLLAGKVLKVTLDAKLLALIPTLVVQHLSFPGNYQMTAFVGPGTPTSITVHSYQGQIVLGIPHKGAFINHVPPKGPNGAFVTPSPFYVPVPVQAGDSDVKGAKVEQPTSIDAKALKKAITPAPTMLSFFGAPKKSLPAPLPPPAGSSESDSIGAGGAGQKRDASAFLSPAGSQSSGSCSSGSAGKKKAKAAGAVKGGIGNFFSAKAPGGASTAKAGAPIDLTEDSE